MRRYVIVGAGGAMGALTRYWLGGFFKIGPGEFPLGTFVINLSGCFGLGLFLTLITERYKLRAEWRLGVATGFVGAYTTFSSFSNEVLTLFRGGYVAVGLLYSVGSLAGGTVCVTLGLVAARLITSGRIGSPPSQAERQIQSGEQVRQKDALPVEERAELDPD